MNSFLSKSIVVALAGLLFGCGGGGGEDTPPVTGTTSFPLQTGYKNNVASGQTVNYAITGSCSGTAIYARSQPINQPAGFEGVVPALQVTSTSNINYSAPCSTSVNPDPGSSTTELYYDSNYNYLGSTETSYYSYMDLPLIAVPMSVTVGQSGVLGEENIDTNDTKTLHLGYTQGSFAVTADTATTAIITETVQVYKAYVGNDPALVGTYYLAATRKEKSRISTNGTLTPVSIEIQSNTASSEVLIFTAI